MRCVQCGATFAPGKREGGDWRYCPKCVKGGGGVSRKRVAASVRKDSYEKRARLYN